MKKFKGSIIIMSIVLSIAAYGCGQRAQDTAEAIELSKRKTTAKEQVKYLAQQANNFINSDDFDEAIKTAKYILSRLDPESSEAKSIIEKAKAEIKKLADQKLAEAKKKLGSFGQ